MPIERSGDGIANRVGVLSHIYFSFYDTPVSNLSALLYVYHFLISALFFVKGSGTLGLMSDNFRMLVVHITGRVARWSSKNT
jgi:hypothetical protein